MKAKHLSLAIAALLVAGGLWLARSLWREHPARFTSPDAGFKSRHRLIDPNNPNPAVMTPVVGQNDMPEGGPRRQASRRLAPPEPNRRFTDFTPEQRVQFARQGHGPGG